MRKPFTNRSWPFWLRAHHLRALVAIVTLMSLSMLFTTFTMRIGERARLSVMDPVYHYQGRRAGREVMSADVHTRDGQDQQPSVPVARVRTGVGEVIQITRNPTKSPAFVKTIKKQMKDQGYILAAGPLMRSKNAIKNRTVTQQDIDETFDMLERKIEETKRQLAKEVELDPAYWNATHPRRLMIVTSWRSGSTFLGQILAEHAGVFNHYEPLMHIGLEQIRPDHPKADAALRHLQDLFRCRYSDEEFVSKIKNNMQDMLSHNAHLWQACVLGPNRNACGSSEFLERACRQFPTLTMKLVRLRLNMTLTMLEADPTLKVLYLVRDPRGTMSSRLSSVDWCSRSADCIDPARLCADVNNDLDAFETLLALYADRVALIKYETLARFPQKTFQAIFDFAGLFYTPRIRDRVEKHTSRDENHPWSTVRKSVERIDLWRQKLNRTQISEIQSVCSGVLTRLGYPFQL